MTVRNPAEPVSVSKFLFEAFPNKRTSMPEIREK